jgi:hypothetical protein
VPSRRFCDSSLNERARAEQAGEMLVHATVVAESRVVVERGPWLMSEARWTAQAR